MENCFPEFRRPPPAKSLPAAAVFQKDNERHPSKVKEVRAKEAAAEIAYLKHRPKDKVVYMNGWPLDAPHLRHTVLYGGEAPPEPTEDTVPLAIMDEASVMEASGMLGLSGARSLAVSLNRTDLSLSMARLAGDTHGGVRVPLPEDIAASTAAARAVEGKVILPPVVLPQVPLPPRPAPALAAAVKIHTSAYTLRPPPADTVTLTANTLTVANCHQGEAADVFNSAQKRVKHVLLPPESVHVSSLTPSGKEGLSAAPFALPTACAVIYDNWVSHTFKALAPGQHVFTDSPSPGGEGLVAPFLVDDLTSSSGGPVPPSAGAGLYLALIPGVASITLRLPPSLTDETPVTLAFMNAHAEHAMEVYWVDYDGKLVVRRVLGPGERYQELTWATHPWVVRDRTSEKSLLVCCGPGVAVSQTTCTALWTATPRRQSLSLSYENAAAKRLVGKPRASLAPTASQLSHVSSGSIVAVESIDTPGELETMLISETVAYPKVNVTLTDDAPEDPLEGRFLRKAFAVRAQKQGRTSKSAK